MRTLVDKALTLESRIQSILLEPTVRGFATRFKGNPWVPA
jgi:hypothetical protein